MAGFAAVAFVAVKVRVVVVMMAAAVIAVGGVGSRPVAGAGQWWNRATARRVVRAACFGAKVMEMVPEPAEWRSVRDSEGLPGPTRRSA